jgi:hypothetical protein
MLWQQASKELMSKFDDFKNFLYLESMATLVKKTSKFFKVLDTFNATCSLNLNMRSR